MELQRNIISKTDKNTFKFNEVPGQFGSTVIERHQITHHHTKNLIFLTFGKYNRSS